MAQANSIVRTFIVPVFNGLRYLPAFWESLRPSLLPGSEIIIIDDASNENVSATFPASSPDVPVLTLRNDRSAGYAATVNRAMREAQGNVFFHLNTDLILQNETCLNLEKSVVNSPDVGIAGAKLIFPQTGTLQHIGIAFTKFTKFHFFMNMRPDHPLAMKSRTVQATTGAALCFRRDVYNKLGPMDEELYNCNEDVDYCLRAAEHGLSSVVEANAIAYHWESQSGYARFVRLAENEATFWGKWRDRINPDIGLYIAEGLSWLFDQNPQAKDRPFSILNLSKGATDRVVADTLRQFLPRVADDPEFDYRQLNNSSNSYFLPMILPYSMILHARPFIYITDDFLELAKNNYWFQRRRERVGDELVVDHLGNSRWTSEMTGGVDGGGQ